VLRLDPNLAAHVVAATTKASAASKFTPLLFMGVIFAAMYFLVLRPRNKKAQKARTEAQSAGVGSRVLLAGGLVATIIAERGDEYDVMLSPDTTATVVKQAVLRVYVPTGEGSTATSDETPQTAVGDSEASA